MTRLRRDASETHGWPLEDDFDERPERPRWPGKRTRTLSLPARPIYRRAQDNDTDVDPRAHALLERADGASGAPLRADVRERFEGSLGADLSAVRVHVGGASADAADAIGARAYAVGNDIHFGAGQYAPDDPFGLHLLAHEVAHTQQSGSSATTQSKPAVSTPGDTAEIEADHAADAMVAGAPFEIRGHAGGAIHRAPDPAAAAPAAKAKGPQLAPGKTAFGSAPDGGKVIYANAEDAKSWAVKSRMVWDLFCRRYFPAATADQIAQAYRDLAVVTHEADPDGTTMAWAIGAETVGRARDWMKDHKVSIPVGSGGGDDETATPGGQGGVGSVGIEGGTGKPGEMDNATAERTVAQVNELYDYLLKNWPDHPIFKNKKATVADLVAYLAEQEAVEKGAYDGVNMMDNDPERFRRFLDKWERGDQLYAPTTDPTKPPESGALVMFQPAGQIVIEPETGGVYATGNWVVFRVQFANNENNLINVEPNRATFAWTVVGQDIKDKKGETVEAAGPKDGTSHGDLPSARAVWSMDMFRSLPAARGQVEYRVELGKPGAYAVGCNITSEHFKSTTFSPAKRNVIVRTAKEREAEVFEQHMHEAAESPFRRADDDSGWEIRKGARALTIEDRLAAAKARRQLVVDAAEQGKIGEDVRDDALEKVDEEIKKLEALSGEQKTEIQGAANGTDGVADPYIIHGAFFDEVRGSNGALSLTAYGVKRTEGNETSFTFVMIEGSQGKLEKHTATIAGTFNEKLERQTIGAAVAHFQSTNRLPDGNAIIVVKLVTTGATCEWKTSTKNAVKTVKEAAANFVKWGTVVVCTLTVAGAEIPLIVGGAVALAGAVGPSADMMQRARTGRFGDSVSEEALDLLDLAAQVAPLGVSAIKAPAGWKAIGLQAADKGQALIVAARTHEEIEQVNARYAELLMAPDAKKAELEQQRKEEIAGLLANAVQTGTLMLVMSGAQAHSSTPHAPPSESSKWKGRMNDRLADFASKATETELRDRLNQDGKRLNRFEREFLEDWLRFHERERASAETKAPAEPTDSPAPTESAAPSPNADPPPGPSTSAAKPPAASAPKTSAASPDATTPPASGAAASATPEATADGLIGTLEKQQALPEQHAHADGSAPASSVMAEPDGLGVEARGRQIGDLKEMIKEVGAARDRSLADLRSGKRKQDGDKVSPGDRVELTKGADALGKEQGLLDRLLAAKEKLQDAERRGAPADEIDLLRATVVSAVTEYQSHLAMRKPDYAVYTEDVQTGVEFFRRYKMIMGHELSPREIADARASAGQLASQELRVGFDGTDLAPVRDMAAEFNTAHDSAAWDGDFKDVSLVLNTTKKKTASTDPSKNQNQAMGQFVDEWMTGGELRTAFSGMDNAGVEHADMAPALMWEAAAKRTFGNAKLLRDSIVREVPADQRAALATCLARVRDGDVPAATAALEHFLGHDLDGAQAAVTARAEAGRKSVGKDLPAMAASTVNERFGDLTIEEVSIENRQLMDALRAMRAETGDRRALPDQLGLTIHAGEQLRSVSPFALLDQVEQSISLGTDRIGHGLILGIDPAKLVEMGRLTKDQVADFTARQIEVRDHARRSGVVIEMNMTSNTEISNLKGSEHPGAAMVVDQDLRVSASTDDETVLHTTVADELRRLAAAPGVTRADVAEVVLEGFYSRLGGRELRDRGRLKRQYSDALTAGLSAPENALLAKRLAERFHVAPVEGDTRATLARVLDAVFGVGGYDFNPAEI